MRIEFKMFLFASVIGLMAGWLTWSFFYGAVNFLIAILCLKVGCELKEKEAHPEK